MPVKISTGAKSRMASLVESWTRRGLRYGIPATALSAAYLLYLVFGPKLHSVAAMTANDRAYLHASAATAMTVLHYAALVVALSLALRFLYEPLAGQIMSLAGAAFYFLGPPAFSLATGGGLDKIQTYHEIVVALSRVGFIFLMPGGILVMRDIEARITDRVRARRRVMNLLAGVRPEDKPKRRKLYEKCWEMPLCQEFVRQYCPAWNRKRSCWRMKSGCQCDSIAISKAMAMGAPNDWLSRSFMEGAQEDAKRNEQLSAGQKRARCRKCMIYSEHQRQKYRILSALAFPAVGLAFYLSYGWLTSIAWVILGDMDRFMSFLAYSSGKAPSFASQGHILTTLALIWLAIVALSYALKAVEYLIFDLQV